MNTNEAVIKALENKGKPMKAGEIAEATGLDKKEVEKSIKALVKEMKVHSPVRCFYDLKS